MAEVDEVNVQLIKRVEGRVDRLEEDIKEIRSNLSQQAVTQSRTETTLTNLVEEVKAFRTDFMGLLTESIKATQTQNASWHDVAVKVVLSLLGLVAAAYGLTQLVK